MIPAININLDARHTTCSGDIHADDSCTPVLIPCPIRRSVTFVARLGECTCAMAHYVEKMAAHQNDPVCPGRPIHVSCSVSGETWEESEVVDVEMPESIETDPARGQDRVTLEAACRERWALVKALVLGQDVTLSSHRHFEAVRTLLQQRDAVFSALTDMVRAEDVAAAAQRSIGLLPAGRWHDLPPDERPSRFALERYVERLIERVGVLP